MAQLELFSFRGNRPEEKIVRVHETLCAAYGCPIAYFHDLDPLSELVSSLLSHRTRNGVSRDAYRALRARYYDESRGWQPLMNADEREIEAEIRGVTWPEVKARWIKSALREIASRRQGCLSLDFLREWPADRARDWLAEIRGVGAKTSAAVIAFSDLRGRALVVDSHHHRVATRLGLLRARTSLAEAHVLLEAQLPGEWDAQAFYDHHEVMMIHGQRTCTYRDPACERCPVLELCPFGQARRAGSLTSATPAGA